MAVTEGPHLPRHLWARLVVGAAVLLALFAFVTVRYDAEGRMDLVGGSTSSTGFVVGIAPVDVRPAASTSTVRFTLTDAAPDLLDATGRLGQNTRVTIITDTGVTEQRFPAGTVPLAVEVAAGVDGDLALYPFDNHAGVVSMQVDEYATSADGTVTSVRPIPVAISAAGGVNGWTTSLTAPTAESTTPQVDLQFARAFSTRAFALLVVGLSVVLAILSLAVGLLVRLRRRVVEAALLSWSAALLFALPALRNFMPGSPPIGVALDVYVFLWVIASAVLGAVLVVLAWIDRDRPVATSS